MGLDNGIILEVPKYVKVENDFYFKELEKNEGNSNDEFTCYDIAYWRKCWGIRDVIITTFHFDKNGGHSDLEKEDLPKLIKVLSKFLLKDYFDENADSIWEYEDLFEDMLDVILKLKWLIGFLTQYPACKLYFYDSF